MINVSTIISALDWARRQRSIIDNVQNELTTTRKLVDDLAGSRRALEEFGADLRRPADAMSRMLSVSDAASRVARSQFAWVDAGRSAVAEATAHLGRPESVAAPIGAASTLVSSADSFRQLSQELEAQALEILHPPSLDSLADTATAVAQSDLLREYERISESARDYFDLGRTARDQIAALIPDLESVALRQTLGDELPHIDPFQLGATIEFVRRRYAAHREAGRSRTESRDRVVGEAQELVRKRSWRERVVFAFTIVGGLAGAHYLMDVFLCGEEDCLLRSQSPAAAAAEVRPDPGAGDRGQVGHIASGTVVTVVQPTVHIRERPGFDGEIRSKINGGAHVEVLALTGEWVRIRAYVNGSGEQAEGWIPVTAVGGAPGR